MAKEVKFLKGREPPCKVTVEGTRFLPEYHEDEATESCIGGIVAYAKKGRIVCSNTFDERLQLCFQEAIPDIRKTLFPSFTKPPVEKKPVAAAGHHH